MTSREIEDLVVAISPDSPYYRIALGEPPDGEVYSLSERLRVALADPAIGWNLARSYTEAALPLPDACRTPAITRAYAFLSDQLTHDLTLAMTYELQLPPASSARDLIRALIVAGASDEQIATLFPLEAEHISLFEQLWFNFRDRKREILYQLQLRCGGEAAPSGCSGPLSSGTSLMRRGWKTRDQNAVLHAAKLASMAAPNVPEEQLAAEIEEKLIGEASAGVARGLFSKRDNPALSWLSYLKKSVWAEAPYVDSLTEVGFEYGDEARRELIRQAEERLKLEREYIEKSPDAVANSDDGSALPTERDDDRKDQTSNTNI